MIGYLAQNHSLIHAFAEPARARRTRRESLAVSRIFRAATRLADAVREEEAVAVRGTLDRPISGLATDSRCVVPGSLFFALPGGTAGGAASIDEAVSRGAVAVVTRQLPLLPPARVTFIRVVDPRATLARAAQRFYGFPDRELNVVGVTGARGKTTVAHLLQHLLGADQRVGLLGSICYDLGARTVPAPCAAPEALDTFGLMAQMRDAGCRQAVLEISARGLEQQSVRGLRLGAAVCTNLAAEPADSGAERGGAPDPTRRFFTGGCGAAPRVAVFNLDDAPSARLAAQVRAEVPGTTVVTYGEDPGAQVRAEQVVLGIGRTTFRLVWPGGAWSVDSPLIGRPNVSNLLAAVATAWGLGRDPLVVLSRLRAFAGVPGRMERIEAGQAFRVIVDAAASADALRHALAALRPITSGRLLVVFGCGARGERAERPRMTRVVQDLAEFALATADSPRHEALPQIFAEMRAGVVAPERITWIEDRRRAIGLALALARPGDCVLIAGKGHEGCQELADTVFPFDDRQVAREWLGARANGRLN